MFAPPEGIPLPDDESPLRAFAFDTQVARHAERRARAPCPTVDTGESVLFSAAPFPDVAQPPAPESLSDAQRGVSAFAFHVQVRQVRHCTQPAVDATNPFAAAVEPIPASHPPAVSAAPFAFAAQHTAVPAADNPFAARPSLTDPTPPPPPRPARVVPAVTAISAAELGPVASTAFVPSPAPTPPAATSTVSAVAVVSADPAPTEGTVPCDAEEELPPGEACVVCLSAARSHICLPCMHYVLCAECSDAVSAQGQCPVCREPTCVKRVFR